jgi:hypothetical protein
MASKILDRTAFFPISVWWQGLDNMETWVKDRGVNIFWWDKQIYGNVGDFEAMHQKIEALRQKGYNVWVIRQPANYLLPDKLDFTFDQKWKSHIYSFDLDDEFEDKVPGGNLWSNWQPIADYVKQRATAYKAWMPDIPIIANFNGTHPNIALKDRYDAIIGAGIDIVSYDAYPCAYNQINSQGKLLYPDIVQGYVGNVKLFKSWYPNKPVWCFADCCNQDICVAGAPGWSDNWKFVGSRCLTPTELMQIATTLKQYGGGGFAYFPQPHNGGVADATEPSLIPTMAKLSTMLQSMAPISPSVACSISRDLQNKRWNVVIPSTAKTVYISDPSTVAALDAAVVRTPK